MNDMRHWAPLCAIWLATAFIALFANQDIGSWIGWSVGATALVVFFG